MTGHHRWAVGLATSTGLIGLTVTSGMEMLAHRFVDEYSRPPTLLDVSQFTWGLPRHTTEPALSRQRSLLFRTADGMLLRGDFWAQPHPAPTIVLCHGYRTSRSHLRSAAALE